ncbi:MAG TPA: BBP7 family outer membrane beta-barrel protein [Pirellulales bacterium]|nr:BBP7 family outer membrane beta-barrel protein [Pirellulales bacterium]
MNGRYLASLAATLVASLCVAAEPSPDEAQVRRPYVHSALVASSQRAKSAPFSAKQPVATWQQKPGKRTDMMAYADSESLPFQVARQERPQAPQDSQEPLADPFAEPAPTEVQPTEPSAEPPMESAPGAAAPSEPPADVFEMPPAEETPGVAPRDTAPLREAPRREAPRQERPYYGEPPSQRAPAARPPARSAAPRGAAEQPPEFVPAPEPEPESGYDQGSFDGFGMPFGEDDFVDGCMSCVESGCGNLWDSYCPPPLHLRIPPGSWVNMDYLMWWSRGASLPALVTSSPTGGALDSPNLKILFGDDRVDNGIRSGGRLNIGTWFNARQTFGVGATFLQLQNMATNFSAVSDGSTILAQPFFNTLTHAPDSAVIAQSGLLSGGVQARTTDSFVGGDAYLRSNLWLAPRGRIDLIYGWRYLQLSDSVSIGDSSVSIDPNNPQVPLGTTFTGSDIFRATNKFQGGMIGFQTERRRGIWSLTTIGKLGLGNMHETVFINGYSTTAVPGVGSTNFVGNVLTQRSNIGRYDRNVFSAIPEVNVNLGLQVTPRLRATFGYSAIYIGRVAQAGNQINLNVDPNSFGGGAGNAPTFSWHQNSYWLQGMNFGLNYKF